MFKLVKSGTIKDGSEYTHYHDTKYNNYYFIVNDQGYMLNDSTDIFNLHLSQAYIAFEFNINSVLVIPTAIGYNVIAFDLVHDHYGRFIQRSAITFTENTINIDKRSFRVVEGVHDSKQEYIYYMKDKVLYAYLPSTCSSYMFKCIDEQSLTFGCEVLKSDTKSDNVSDNVSDYTLFLEHFKHFQTQTIKKVAEVDCAQMTNCITTLATITDDITRLGEFYDK